MVVKVKEAARSGEEPKKVSDKQKQKKTYMIAGKVV